MNKNGILTGNRIWDRRWKMGDERWKMEVGRGKNIDYRRLSFFKPLNYLGFIEVILGLFQWLLGCGLILFWLVLGFRMWCKRILLCCF